MAASTSRCSEQRLLRSKSEYHESQESAYEHYEYGVALAELGEIECSGKECYAYGKVDGIVGWRAEVLLVHKQHGSRSYQSYDCRAQAFEDVLYNLRVLVVDEIARNKYHYYKRQPYYAQRRYY